MEAGFVGIDLGTTFSAVATLKKGTKVDIVGKTTGWYKISYGGSTGYMSSDYVAIDDGTATEEPAPVLASASTSSTLLNTSR